MRLFNSTLQPTSEDLEPSIPLWVRGVHGDFLKIINNDNKIFPCVFASNAYLNGSIFFSYLDENEVNNPIAIQQAINVFIDNYSFGKNYPVLVIFIQVLQKTLPKHEIIFWELLNSLLENDKNWPMTATKQTNDYNWKFYLNNTPIFINGHSNQYVKRTSRYCPSDMMIVIQNYENLNQLHLRHSKISKIIRNNILQYDTMPISEVFGSDFNDKENYDWKQFWLADEDKFIDKNKKCPLIIR